MEIQKILVGAWLALNFVLVALIDTRAWVSPAIGMEGTMSRILGHWIKEWPIIAAVMGGLLVHLVGW